MGPDMDQWLSPYGYILVLKLGLLTTLLGFAIWNRLVLTGPVLRGDVVSTDHMRKSISAEIILVVLILGLVAGWRFTPPPRALALVESEPVSLHIHTSQVMADVAITPGQAGTNAVSIYLSDGDFCPLNRLRLRSRLQRRRLESKRYGQPPSSKATASGMQRTLRCQ